MSGTEIVHIYVSGEVQGVGFRYSVHQMAHDTGVSGWVKNLPDGRVEAVFEGESESVDEMIEWCRSGPSHASVSDVEVERDTDLPRDFEGFEVR